MNFSTNWRDRRNFLAPPQYTFASYCTDSKTDMKNTFGDELFLNSLYLGPDPLRKNLADTLITEEKMATKNSKTELEKEETEAEESTHIHEDYHTSPLTGITNFFSGVLNVISNAMFSKRKPADFDSNSGPEMAVPSMWHGAKFSDENKILQDEFSDDISSEIFASEMTSCRAAAAHCKSKLDQVRVLLGTSKPVPCSLRVRRRPKKIFVEANSVEDCFEDAFSPEDFENLADDSYIEFTSPACYHDHIFHNIDGPKTKTEAAVNPKVSESVKTDSELPKMVSEGSKPVVSPTVTLQSPKVMSFSPKVPSQSPKEISSSPKVLSQSPKVYSQSPKMTPQQTKVVAETPKVIPATHKEISKSPKVALELPKVVPANPTKALATTKVSETPKLVADTPKMASQAKTETPEVVPKSTPMVIEEPLPVHRITEVSNTAPNKSDSCPLVCESTEIVQNVPEFITNNNKLENESKKELVEACEDKLTKLKLLLQERRKKSKVVIEPTESVTALPPSEVKETVTVTPSKVEQPVLVAQSKVEQPVSVAPSKVEQPVSVAPSKLEESMTVASSKVEVPLSMAPNKLKEPVTKPSSKLESEAEPLVKLPPRPKPSNNKVKDKRFKNPNRTSDKRRKSRMKKNIHDDVLFANEIHSEDLSSSVENSPSMSNMEKYIGAHKKLEQPTPPLPVPGKEYFDEVSGKFRSASVESEDSFQIVFNDSPKFRRASDCDSEDSFIIFEDSPDSCYTNNDVFGDTTDSDDYDSDSDVSDSGCGTFKLSASLSKSVSNLADDSLYVDHSEDEVDCANVHDLTECDHLTVSDIDVSGESKGLLIDERKKLLRKDQPAKRVHFSTDPPKVHVMRVWLYAAKQTRVRYWEQFVTDRERFKRRIADVDMAVSWVLKPQHRSRVMFQRFMPWWNAQKRKELAEKKEKAAQEKLKEEERLRNEEIAKEEERLRNEKIEMEKGTLTNDSDNSDAAEGKEDTAKVENAVDSNKDVSRNKVEGKKGDNDTLVKKEMKCQNLKQDSTQSNEKVKDNKNVSIENTKNINNSLDGKLYSNHILPYNEKILDLKPDYVSGILKT